MYQVQNFFPCLAKYSFHPTKMGDRRVGHTPVEMPDTLNQIFEKQTKKLVLTKYIHIQVQVHSQNTKRNDGGRKTSRRAKNKSTEASNFMASTFSVARVTPFWEGFLYELYMTV